ncbi:hypothetical protein COCSUDRAFT_56002 [Coccomyxa subellipsoidea C-169]|uniref:SET domain-containing protein n=1 Tax=Coccomyxa subellipsoidea (strain C-169) TaxID=574566 RepID=I0YV89_COCSC|nr:hypothetical protein COCSUDRAFT_56002 [Coccomyxa subellipsoidea C-169]EIE22308.1 hypothetical protein COCSUDRAFT_56002 [Coccomyxa subellipsoidea C-169]|eukprot:XP_005646852.1 hypothetical protein COCSUDRAFT_56002 [Coccomyxa subellipsoidea C-169]
MACMQEDLVDHKDMKKLVEHLTAAMSSYLAGDPAHRLKLMGDHVDVFEIEDPDHPAKRCTANLQWLGLRPQERGLRAKKDLAQWHVLGEYCGVVKTGAQLELDAIAACASDERVTGYIIKDKVEAFDTDVALPGDHWAIGREIVIDASRARNCLALINDPRGFPGGKMANVMSVQVLDCATGQLHLFIITKRPVKAGEELLLDYGKNYWENMDAKVACAKRAAADKQRFAALEAALGDAKKLADSENKRCLEAHGRLKQREEEVQRCGGELKKKEEELKHRGGEVKLREGELRQCREELKRRGEELMHCIEELRLSGGKLRQREEELRCMWHAREAQVTEVQGSRHAQEKSNAALQDCMHVLHEKQVELTRLQASNCSANLLRQDIIAAETKLRALEQRHKAESEARMHKEAELERQVAHYHSAAETAERQAASLASAHAQDVETIATLQAANKSLMQELARPQKRAFCPPPLQLPPIAAAVGQVVNARCLDQPAAPEPGIPAVDEATKHGAAGDSTAETGEKQPDLDDLLARMNIGKGLRTGQESSIFEKPIKGIPSNQPAFVTQAALERGLELIAPSLPTSAGLPNDRTNELPGAAAAHNQQVAHARQAEVNQRDEEEGAEVSKRSCYDCCSKMSMRKINAAEGRSPAAESKAHKAHTGRASSGHEPRSGRDRREIHAGNEKRRADGRGGDYCRHYSPDERAIYRGGYRGRSRFRKRSRGRSPGVSRSRSRTGGRTRN